MTARAVRLLLVCLACPPLSAATMSGTVRQPDGTPAVGIRVRVWCGTGLDPGGVIVETNEAGRFAAEIQPVPERAVMVSAFADAGVAG